MWKESSNVTSCQTGSKGCPQRQCNVYPLQYQTLGNIFESTINRVEFPVLWKICLRDGEPTVLGKLNKFPFLKCKKGDFTLKVKCLRDVVKWDENG